MITTATRFQSGESCTFERRMRSSRPRACAYFDDTRHATTALMPSVASPLAFAAADQTPMDAADE